MSAGDQGTESASQDLAAIEQFKAAES